MQHTNQRGLKDDKKRMTLLRMAGMFMLTMAFSFSGAAAWADKDHKGYGHDPKAHLEKLTEKLSLTQEQQDKILPIIEEKHQKMGDLFKQMKEIRHQAMEKIEAELTPEQQEKWQDMQEKRKEKMKQCKEKHGKKSKKDMQDHHD